MQEINDELMMPCAQCCRKHLSAAIAHWVLGNGEPETPEHNLDARVLVARAIVNYTEDWQGYHSHRAFADGLLVAAENCAESDLLRIAIRSFRLSDKKGPEITLVDPAVNHYLFYRAHLAEAEREFPDIVTAVVPEPRRGNESEPELRQAEVNYRLAQLRWLDENVFGITPVEKGDKKMACKKSAKPVAKAAAKKAACKGGKCKGGCKK